MSIAPKIDRAWCVGVVVPAQDEAQSIERCVSSILAAHAACGRAIRLWIVVVADDCADGTAGAARAAIGRHGEVLECAVHSPGSARALGVAAVMKHFAPIHPGNIWLANTDADTYVPDDWLRLHLDYAEDDAHAVAGIVRLDPSDGLADAIRVHNESYELRSDGTHGHVHGANLGVRGDAYLSVGGWSHLRVAEDHCLWRRLQVAGWRMRSSVRSVVLTSARLHGRAVGGFADTLRLRLAGSRG